jgi:hypothetical protein
VLIEAGIKCADAFIAASSSECHIIGAPLPEHCGAARGCAPRPAPAKFITGWG